MALLQNRISYKAVEIEDVIDLYFYHPFGYILAMFFNKLRFSPNTVSMIGMILGMLGGFMIYLDRFLYASFLIVFASILDSSDGQLARISGKTSVYGRIIDGLVGYAVFASVYVFIFLRYYNEYGFFKYLILMFFSAVSNSIHSSIYDFYRTAYISVVRNKFDDIFYEKKSSFYDKIYEFYTLIQKKVCSIHMGVLRKIYDNKIDDEKIKIYKSKMLSNIQFVNLLGDNWKINGIIFLFILNRVKWFYFYVIFILNFVFLVVVLKQRKIDKEILEVL